MLSRYMLLPDSSHYKTLVFGCWQFCEALGEDRGKFAMPGTSPHLNLLFNYLIEF